MSGDTCPLPAAPRQPNGISTSGEPRPPGTGGSSASFIICSAVVPEFSKKENCDGGAALAASPTQHPPSMRAPQRLSGESSSFSGTVFLSDGVKTLPLPAE